MRVGESETVAPPKRTLSQDVFGATLWNSLLLPLRVALSLFTSVVYFQVLSRAEVGVILFLQNLANTVGAYVDLGVERTVPRFLPEVEQVEGPSGVRRLLRRILDLRMLVLIPVVLCLLAFAHPLAARLAARQRMEAVAAESRAAAIVRPAPESEALHEKAAADRALADLLETHGLLLLSAVAALVVIGAFHDVLMQVLTAFFRRRDWNAITLTGNMLQPLLVTGLVLFGLGVPGVLMGLVITPLVCILLSGRAARATVRRLPEAPAPGALPDLGKRFARFAGFTWIISLTTWLYDLPFLVLFAARSLPLEQVALLGFAYKYAKDFLIYAFWPFVGLVQPVLARVKARESPEALGDAYSSLVRIVWLGLLPAGTGLALLSPPLIAALYPKYAESAGLAVVFVAFVFLETLLHIAPLVMMTTERYRPLLLSRLLCLLSLPALAVFLPRYGLFGASVALGVVRLLPALVASAYVSRSMGLRLPLRFGARLVLACASFGLPLWLLLRSGMGPADALGAVRPSALLPLLGLALLGAALFLVVLKASGGLEEPDRRRLLALNLPAKQLLARLL